MSWRARLGLWLAAGYVGSWLFLALLTLLGVNPKDPTLADAGYQVVYETAGDFPTSRAAGAGGEFALLSNGRQLTYVGTRGQIVTDLRPDGTVDDGIYPLLCLRLPNPVLHFGPRPFRLPVRDDAGLVGEPGRVYEARDLGSFIRWDYRIGSQASHRAGIFDGERRVATAVYDATCGLLFDLTAHDRGFGELRLSRTDFPISRNRYILAYWAAGFGVLVIGVHAWRLVRAPRDRRAGAANRLDLAVAIAVTLAVDYTYDIWFFHLGGDRGTVLLHLAAFALFGYLFRWWALGLLLELAWPLAFLIAGEGRMIPGVTYFPAMLITLVLLLAVRRAPRDRPDERSS